MLPGSRKAALLCASAPPGLPDITARAAPNVMSADQSRKPRMMHAWIEVAVLEYVGVIVISVHLENPSQI
jgi:hypothetical protein